jgi:hypothetical protein
MSPSAPSRYGSAGELPAWVPIVSGPAALGGVFPGIAPHAGQWQLEGSAAAACNLSATVRTLTRLPNRPLKSKLDGLFSREFLEAIKDSKVCYTDLNLLECSVCTSLPVPEFYVCTAEWFTPVPGLGPGLCHDRGPLA